MKRILLGSVVLLINFSSNALEILSIKSKTYAEESPRLTTSCRNAIERVREKITKTPGGLRVAYTVTRMNNSPFPDAPFALGVLIVGRGHSNLMKSPVFANSLAKEIILDCNPISSVSFSPVWPSPDGKKGYVGTGWLVEFGSIGNRENVAPFKCTTQVSDRGGCGGKISWGEIDCGC